MGARKAAKGGMLTPRVIAADPYRAIVFPNHLRALRSARGFATLLEMSSAIPEIPYIRLSKIERGEVVARADELVRIAAFLETDPHALLIDEARLDIAAWAEENHEARPVDPREEEFAIKLGAALRHRRASDRRLSIAVLDKDYGIPPVMLSRIENAQKPFERWNEATRASLFRLFGVKDEPGLRAEVERLHASGALDPVIHGICNPELRMARMRSRLAELRAQLPPKGATVPADEAASSPSEDSGVTLVRLLPVFGTPLPDGLIAHVPAPGSVEAPRTAGPRAFGLRVCRPTLGGGLPARAIVVVDPDRPPSPGGLAAVRTGDAWRLLSVACDRHGAMKGYSENPDHEIALDELDPADVCAVVSAAFE